MVQATKSKPIVISRFKAAREAEPRPMPGSLFTHPAASVVTGICDGKLPKLDSLPFVKKRRPKEKGGGYCYWAVEPSGNYSCDWATGSEYARMLLPFLKYNLGITLLGSIVLDMIEAGDTEKGKGLILGFMAELSRELSSTRASLAFFAAAVAKPPPRTPARSKAVLLTLKRLATENAGPTLKRLGSVI